MNADVVGAVAVVGEYKVFAASAAAASAFASASASAADTSAR